MKAGMKWNRVKDATNAVVSKNATKNKAPENQGEGGNRKLTVTQSYLQVTGMWIKKSCKAANSQLCENKWTM
jgi:hypothetical protein